VNSYTIAEIFEGMSETFSVTVTEDMLRQFRELSGDVNPLHCDEDYARARGYGGRVVYGMLGASLLSTLAGVYLPGERCLLHEVDVKFKKPVFVGDTLTVSGVVSGKSEALRRLTIAARITNQRGETVSRATVMAGVLE
jgi:acyl dehydratase